MNDLHKLADLCKGKHIYIETHNIPDPDAIASAFGLQRFLELHNVRFTLCYGGWLDTICGQQHRKQSVYGYTDTADGGYCTDAGAGAPYCAGTLHSI